MHAVWNELANLNKRWDKFIFILLTATYSICETFRFQVALDHWPIDQYPPSVNSVSGYSSGSVVSTATTVRNYNCKKFIDSS